MAGNNKVTMRTIPHTSSQTKEDRSLKESLNSMANALDTPPEEFDETKEYQVKLSTSVQIPGTDTWLRPSETTVVSGALANTIKSSILKASVFVGGA